MTHRHTPDPGALAGTLSDALDQEVHVQMLKPVAGGDSHKALQMVTDRGDWFIKWNDQGALPAFRAEQAGLEALAAAVQPAAAHSRAKAMTPPAGRDLLIPLPVALGNDEHHAWLILPWLQLQAGGDAERLARGLLQVHRHQDKNFGWQQDSYLGASRQCNSPHTDWAEFWWQCRMLPQLEQASARGHGQYLGPRITALEQATRSLLNHEPLPSLLHGDLWGGNHGYCPDGMPVIFDPACYHGDRETDLAMMRLFGGFDPQVLDSYLSSWPLPPGAGTRCDLYQGYHLLNHLNLFGGGWLARVEQCIDAILRH
ncbi:MAG: fructosamine kinase family protein [Xanthomonadales bacterium]|nr:fructosamine kinase family protein [Xanthomonadales bacterium]